jgi:RNA polymerase sigma-19 factor, ECF subfamily
MKPSGVKNLMDVRDRKKNARLVLGLMETHGGILHSFLTRELRAKDGASDLMQEVFVRLMRVDRAELIRDPVAYLFHIAVQVLGDFRSKEKKRLTDGSDVLEQAEAEGKLIAPVDLLEQEHAKRELQRLLTTLSKLQRTVFLLRKRDGCSTDEIAKALQITPTQVKRYLVEANAKLQAKLGEESR